VRRESSGPAAGLDIIHGALDLAIKIGAFLLIVVTGYYAYATVSHGDELFRGMTPMGTPVTVAAFQAKSLQMVQVMKILHLVCGILVLAVIAKYYSYPEAGGALLVVGALLFLGMPFVIDNMGGQGVVHASLRRMADPRALLRNQFALAGIIMAAPGLVQLIIHAVYFVVSARERRPKADAEAMKTATSVRKPNDTLLGPCWKLPFCRDTEKQLCPIRQSKKPCWRTGRGCYCDQNVILTLSGGSAYQASRGSAGFLMKAAAVAKPKSFSEKRAQCLSCPVYLHHQGHKYKMLAPLMLLGAVGAMAFYWTTLQGLYPQGIKTLGRALSGFSFGTSAGAVPAWANDMAGNSGMMWLLLIVLALLVIAYIMNGLEWVLYKLGI